LKLAAIDIGSNSIKLVVVDAAAGDSFTVLTREREVVRLGHETLLKGHIGPDAMTRAVECIKRLRSVAEARGAEAIVAIATASVREANNAADFVRAIEEDAGVRVQVLSGIEEARLIGLAASQGCSDKKVATLNIDIGGGSTEISIFRDGQPVSLMSVKLGAVGLTERFLVSDPPAPHELQALQVEIQTALEGPARELSDHGWQAATGTSGTILAIGVMLHNSVITFEALAQWNAMVSALTTVQRQDAAGMTAQRAEIIVAGGQVLEGTMRALGIESLRTCDWALREGVIIDHLRK
jgi:exopolyphosphatase/guanosine-5'-triphosphate,3'-diphosphate pyrophosphatase